MKLFILVCAILLPGSLGANFPVDQYTSSIPMYYNSAIMTVSTMFGQDPSSYSQSFDSLGSMTQDAAVQAYFVEKNNYKPWLNKIIGYMNAAKSSITDCLNSNSAVALNNATQILNNGVSQIEAALKTISCTPDQIDMFISNKLSMVSYSTFSPVQNTLMGFTGSQSTVGSAPISVFSTSIGSGSAYGQPTPLDAVKLVEVMTMQQTDDYYSKSIASLQKLLTGTLNTATGFFLTNLQTAVNNAVSSATTCTPPM